MHHGVDGAFFVHRGFDCIRNSVLGAVPNFNHAIFAFFFSQKSHAILPIDYQNFLFRFGHRSRFFRWHFQVIHTPTDSRLAGHFETKRFDAIDERCSFFLTSGSQNFRHQFFHFFLGQFFIHEAQVLRQNVIEHNAANRSFDDAINVNFDFGIDCHVSKLMSQQSFFVRSKNFAFALHTGFEMRDEINSQHNIFGRHRNWCSRSRFEQVFGRKHNVGTFLARLISQWHMHRHLVSIKVSIESGTNHWMNLNGLTFNQHWLKSLN